MIKPRIYVIPTIHEGGAHTDGISIVKSVDSLQPSDNPAMRTKLTILIPVYNDWDCLSHLLPRISAHLQSAQEQADVLLVDDGSQDPMPITWPMINGGIKSINVLRLKRNLGHQRAICVALCHLRDNVNYEQVLIMDGDGEDDPADVPRLMAELKRNTASNIVFAERARRSEGIIFTFFYYVFLLVHRILVGHRIRVGNFSIMNRDCLESLCVSSELWNHFAAATFSIRQPMSTIQTKRVRRISGKSKMNFPSLVIHGLSAISVFADRVSTRLLIISSLTTILMLIGVGVVSILKFITHAASPGWATAAIGTLLILTLQALTFAFTFCFLVLSSRANMGIVPIRDCKFFIKESTKII